ncbi:MAG: hypothetical protein Q8Q47_03835, partial [Ignavibacteriaceae bacterium]|nr:hypothetical protein [Ignavibacteriaceae bacterium]
FAVQPIQIRLGLDFLEVDFAQVIKAVLVVKRNYVLFGIQQGGLIGRKVSMKDLLTAMSLEKITFFCGVWQQARALITRT